MASALAATQAAGADAHSRLVLHTLFSCCSSAAAAPACCSCRPCRAAFELDNSTVDRRLVVVSACTLAAALLLLLLMMMADGQSSHLLLGEREEAAQMLIDGVRLGYKVVCVCVRCCCVLDVL